VVAYLADLLGRKRSIILGGVGFLVGGLLQTFAANIKVFYGGRLCSGFAIGILSMCAPLYISEAAPTAIRGRMLTVQQLMITIGIVVASSANSIIITTLGRTNIATEWRVAMGLQCLPAVCLICVMLLMPESPRWLATKGRDAEALKTISKLRDEPATGAGTLAEYKLISDDVENEKRIGDGTWGELIGPKLRTRLLIVMGIQAWQQWTGINVILYYQGSLLEKMGFDKDSAAIPFTLANNVINFLATFPGMYLIETMGRKKLLILGGKHVFFGVVRRLSDTVSRFVSFV
jgi:SP family sugar:H+ symporter-like MFS transporter